MGLTLDPSTREVLAAIEDVDFRVTVDPCRAVLLRTSLLYDLHVRPATYIFGQLRDRGLLKQLALRRAGTARWVDFQPLSLVALALRRNEEIEIRVSEPLTRDKLFAVMDVFRRCPRYRNYGAGDAYAMAPAAFDKEFNSDDGAFCMIKLNIENFIFRHLAEIELYILQRNSCALSDWSCIHSHFKSLLFGDFEKFGIMSVDVPLANLMQTRDMCYHLHFTQLQKKRKISYALMGIEWGQENALAWRRNHMNRHRYFYEREQEYYRDLFLVLVLRDDQRLDGFVSTWQDRLDASLQLRGELLAQMRKVEQEMESFSPNFDNPDEFCGHIRLMGELVVRDLSQLTPYVKLLRERRIFHTANGCNKRRV